MLVKKNGIIKLADFGLARYIITLEGLCETRHLQKLWHSESTLHTRSCHSLVPFSWSKISLSNSPRLLFRLEKSRISRLTTWNEIVLFIEAQKEEMLLFSFEKALSSFMRLTARFEISKVCPYFLCRFCWALAATRPPWTSGVWAASSQKWPAGPRTLPATAKSIRSSRFSEFLGRPIRGYHFLLRLFSM